MKELSKKDREIVKLVSEGVPDTQVCRQTGITNDQLIKVLDRVAKRAATYDVAEDAAAMYERALRCRAENAARSLEARFVALLDASPDSVLVINAMTGVIGQVNQNASNLFGYASAELVGRSVEDLVPERYRAIHPAYRKGFLINVRKRQMGYHPPIFALRRDGSEIEVAIALTASIADDDVMVVCSEFARWNAGEARSEETHQQA